MDKVRSFFMVLGDRLVRPPQISASSHRNRGATPSVLFPRCIAITSQLSKVSDLADGFPGSQDCVLFAGTIASNIAYGNENATREEIETSAREANCEFVWGLPDGFDTQS
jgi:hypothetical protein